MWPPDGGLCSLLFMFASQPLVPSVYLPWTDAFLEGQPRETQRHREAEREEPALGEGILLSEPPRKSPRHTPVSAFEEVPASRSMVLNLLNAAVL